MFSAAQTGSNATWKVLLSRCLVVKRGSCCNYSSLRTSLIAVHASSPCLGQENLYFLELSRDFEELHRQHHIFLMDSIVRLNSKALDHPFRRHIWRGSLNKFVIKKTGLGVGSASFWLDEIGT